MTLNLILKISFSVKQQIHQQAQKKEPNLLWQLSPAQTTTTLITTASICHPTKTQT